MPLLHVHMNNGAAEKRKKPIYCIIVWALLMIKASTIGNQKWNQIFWNGEGLDKKTIDFFI